MKTISKYLCDICNREHSTSAFALACEAKGYPEETKDIKEGDTIDFWCQHKASEVGTLETYSEEKGKVIYKFTAFNDKLNNHVDLMVCEVIEPDGNKIERQVLIIDIEKEGKKLFSPSSYKFKLGWAENLKATRK